jgi:hypothetical protein
VAPDSTPEWFREDSSYAGGALKDVFQVEFHMVPVADRKAAIDSVGGTVIGGTRDGPDDIGLYFIHLPGAGSGDSLDTLAEVLRRQPAVRAVLVLVKLEERWRRPNDGAGWQTSDWRRSPLVAPGENWAFEEVNLPLAWACHCGR